MNDEVKKVYFAILKYSKNVFVEESGDGTLLWLCSEHQTHEWSEAELDIVAVFEISRIRKW